MYSVQDGPVNHVQHRLTGVFLDHRRDLDPARIGCCVELDFDRPYHPGSFFCQSSNRRHDGASTHAEIYCVVWFCPRFATSSADRYPGRPGCSSPAPCAGSIVVVRPPCRRTDSRGPSIRRGRTWMLRLAVLPVSPRCAHLVRPTSVWCVLADCGQW